MKYMDYVTTSLSLAPQNRYIPKRFLDIINNKNIDERSADEIVVDIMTKADLHFGGE